MIDLIPQICHLSQHDFCCIPQRCDIFIQRLDIFIVSIKTMMYFVAEGVERL